MMIFLFPLGHTFLIKLRRACTVHACAVVIKKVDQMLLVEFLQCKGDVETQTIIG